MSRLNTLDRLVIMALLLGLAPVATQAQEPDQEPDNQTVQPRGQEPPPSGDGVGETHEDEKSSPLDGISSSEPGYGALVRALNAKEDGNLDKAEVYLREAMDSADSDGQVYWLALEELSFRLPLERAQNMIANEEWQELEALLKTLVAENQSDEQKSMYLLKLIAQLQDHVSAPGISRSGGNGRETIGHIESALQRFLAEYGHYPRDYEELNELLPADQFPLSGYDIVHYVSRDQAYGLTLRSKSNPENVLTVEKTGLLK